MPEPKRPLKVFLCHAHADRDPVRGLYTRLTQDGVDAWFDKAKLLPGQDWELEIRKAVREADVVVVCLSKQFNQAGFRQKEVRLALDTAMEKPEGEIFIIPARLEQCDTLESLRKWHWVDLFEDHGYEVLTRAFFTQANKVGATFHTRNIATEKVEINSNNFYDSIKKGLEEIRLNHPDPLVKNEALKLLEFLDKENKVKRQQSPELSLQALTTNSSPLITRDFPRAPESFIRENQKAKQQLPEIYLKIVLSELRKILDRPGIKMVALIKIDPFVNASRFVDLGYDINSLALLTAFKGVGRILVLLPQAAPNEMIASSIGQLTVLSEFICASTGIGQPLEIGLGGNDYYFTTHWISADVVLCYLTDKGNFPMGHQDVRRACETLNKLDWKQV